MAVTSRGPHSGLIVEVADATEVTLVIQQSAGGRWTKAATFALA
jgi:hypothetical protein